MSTFAQISLHFNSLSRSHSQPTNQPPKQRRQRSWISRHHERDKEPSPSCKAPFFHGRNLIDVIHHHLSLLRCKAVNNKSHQFLSFYYETTLELQQQDSCLVMLPLFTVSFATWWSFRILILNLRSFRGKVHPTLRGPTTMASLSDGPQGEYCIHEHGVLNMEIGGDPVITI